MWAPKLCPITWTLSNGISIFSINFFNISANLLPMLDTRVVSREYNPCASEPHSATRRFTPPLFKYAAFMGSIAIWFRSAFQPCISNLMGRSLLKFPGTSRRAMSISGLKSLLRWKMTQWTQQYSWHIVDNSRLVIEDLNITDLFL